VDGVTVYIADYYNGRVRAVGPDGIIYAVNSRRDAFDAPTRVAFSPAKRWLYVADSSRDQLVVLNIPRTEAAVPASRAPGLSAGPRRTGE
jgi:DNA-binding beta-propeller fold protein YncE